MNIGVINNFFKMNFGSADFLFDISTILNVRFYYTGPIKRITGGQFNVFALENLDIVVVKMHMGKEITFLCSLASWRNQVSAIWSKFKD